jgi:hypothetical protein
MAGIASTRNDFPPEAVLPEREFSAMEALKYGEAKKIYGQGNCYSKTDYAGSADAALRAPVASMGSHESLGDFHDPDHDARQSRRTGRRIPAKPDKTFSLL